MKQITLYNSSSGEDMTACVMLTLCSAWFNADSYLAEELMKAVKIAVFAAMWICWFAMSFFNGLRMRKRFAAEMSAFLTIPCILGVLCENIKFIRFSNTGILISEICKMLSRMPYKAVEDKLDINGMLCSVTAAVLCLLLFGAGYLYTKKMISDAAGDDSGKEDKL